MQNVNDLGIHSRNTLNILHLLSESWFQPHQGDQGVEEEKKRTTAQISRRLPPSGRVWISLVCSREWRRGVGKETLTYLLRLVHSFEALCWPLGQSVDPLIGNILRNLSANCRHVPIRFLFLPLLKHGTFYSFNPSFFLP